MRAIFAWVCAGTLSSHCVPAQSESADVRVLQVLFPPSALSSPGLRKNGCLHQSAASQCFDSTCLLSFCRNSHRPTVFFDGSTCAAACAWSTCATCSVARTPRPARPPPWRSVMAATACRSFHVAPSRCIDQSARCTLCLCVCVLPRATPLRPCAWRCNEMLMRYFVAFPSNRASPRYRVHRVMRYLSADAVVGAPLA